MHPHTLLHKILRGCSTWGEIQSKLESLANKEKGDVFEHLVKAYLQLEPEYASKLKHVWLHQEVPLDLLKKLKLPVTDQGIDIIAETHEGEFWGIQCKYRQQTDQRLAWREISTFSGLVGNCRGITFGLICSTTERITNVLKGQENIGFCALDVWQALDKEFFTRLRAHLAHKPEVLKPLRPRPHQKEAVKDGVAHFVKGKAKRGKLIMPCGSGKSLTAYWLTGALGARRIIIAVPSLALIRQTLKVWLRESVASRQSVRWICVCSDESAGRIDRDDATVLRQDIGAPCLTDSAEIATWLKRKHSGMTVVFTTYQSGEALASAARTAKFRFDLGIMDEAHKTVGATDKLFSHLLHDANLPIARRIFMTATERRYKGQSDDVLSMDDPEIYGKTFHLLSFKRALEYAPPILSDYKIVTIFVSRDEVAELIRQNVFVKPDKGQWTKDIEADMLASLIALRKAMKKYPIRHAVSFHSSIQRAEHFKDHNEAFTRAFPRDGKLETFHVSGRTPTGTRARVIQEFAKTERGLITNARCLTEGVDVPGIDCVLFADPRRSAVDIVQAVGRALRPSKGKEFGYVIVPILHDANATDIDVFKSVEFKEILTTLRALAANDDRIIEYFRAVTEGRKHTSGGCVEFNIDERLIQHIDLRQFVHDIELKCWDRLAKLSWRTFEEARDYVRGLGLRSETEWREFVKGNIQNKGTLPPDIPTTPGRSYADQGWVGMGDWLGTGNTAPRWRKYRDFELARAFARSLKLQNRAEWNEFCRGKLPEKGSLPADIPAYPRQTYTDKGWRGYGDWLGTGFIALSLREYRPYPQARAFAQGLKLESRAHWNEFCKGKLPEKGTLPPDIPMAPDLFYANKGWTGIGDWLGTGTIATNLRQYRPFVDARDFVRNLKLKDGTEWRAFCKGRIPEKGMLPADIPAAPNNTYADRGWKGMGHWLGSGAVATSLRQYRPFEEARAFIRSLGLKSVAGWNEFCKGNLPEHGALPLDIPVCPSRTYAKKGWAGFGDWLGTMTLAPRFRAYRPFREARDFAHKLNLKGQAEWFAFCKGEMPMLGRLPADIPAASNRVYANKGWVDFGDWLGINSVATRFREYRSFREARDFVRKLKLRNNTEWGDFCKGRLSNKGVLPADVPTNPHRTYAKKGWISLGDWLGTGIIASSRREFRSFIQARAFARNLKLKGKAEWVSFCKREMPKSGRLPPDMPSSPDKTYANKGWHGWGDWLGTDRRGSINRAPKKLS